MSMDRSSLRRLAAGTLLPGFVGTEAPAWLARAHRGGLRAVCLYGPNVVDAAQLGALTDGLRRSAPGVLIAIDEEGGDVTRLHYPTGSPQPGNALLGRLDDVGLTRRCAAGIGAELAELGIGLDLAPCVDINSADDNPVIGTRSFGGTPQLVARHTVGWVAGLQGAGVAACAKHFPGHGDTRVDSHFTRPVVPASAVLLEDRELVPFAAAVEADVAAVMVAHVVVPAVDEEEPASFSAPLVEGVLRGRLGFAGVVVTDALDMVGASGGIGVPAAAVAAMRAGCDLLCLGSETEEGTVEAVLDALVAAVESGKLAAERLADADARVSRLRADYPSTAAPGTGGVRYAALPAEVIASGFEVGPLARQWLESPGTPVIVQVETPATPAVGQVPWGPGAVGATTPPDRLPGDARVAVVGRSLTPDHPARQLAARLRAEGRRTLLVECGWPRGEAADLVTFGASQAVGRALAALLLGRPPT